MPSFAVRQKHLIGYVSSKAWTSWILPPLSGLPLISSSPSPATSGARGPTFLLTCLAPQQALRPRSSSSLSLKVWLSDLFLFLLLLTRCRFSPVLGYFLLQGRGFISKKITLRPERPEH